MYSCMAVARGGSNGVEILAKASAVLDVLRVEGQASVPRIAESVHEPVSSMYRLISSLSEVGWVEPGTRRGQYRIGAAIFSIGGLVEGRLNLQEIARSVLWPRRSETTGTWLLYVRRALRAVCIEIVADFVAERLSPRVGSSLPLDEGAASLVLVAFLPSSERDATLEQLLATRSGGRATVDARHRFRVDAEQVRHEGFAIDIEETAPGVASVAAPVLNRRGEIEAAICLSGLDTQHVRTGAAMEDLELVRLTARKISEGFGYLGSGDHPAAEPAVDGAAGA